MNGDGIPVVGEEPGPGPPSPPRLPGWIVAVTALVAIVAVVIISPTPRASTTETTSPLPSIPPLSTTTTAPDGATPSEGIAVEATLVWIPAIGLETAHGITEVIWFDGDWYAVGRDASGPAVWRSRGGITWNLASRLDVDPQAKVVDATVLGEELVVAVNEADGVATDGLLMSSRDGQSWERHQLSASDPDIRHSSMSQVVGVPGGVLVLGYELPRIDSLLAVVPPDAVELVRTGRAWIEDEGPRLAVKVPPGLVVTAVDSTGLEPRPDRAPRPVQWSGLDLEELRAGGEEARVHSVRPTAGGGFIAMTHGPISKMVTSHDGLNWTEHPLSYGGFSFEPWQNGIVTLSAISGHVVSADPLTRDRRLLSPDQFHADTASQPTGFATGGAGIVVLMQETSPAPTTSTVVISEGELEMNVGRVYQLELIDGDDRWSHVVWGMTADLEGDQLSFQIADSPTVTVTLDDWFGAVDAFDVNGLSPGRTHILHSADGRHWSETPWDLLAGGDPYPSGPVVVLSTDEFVVAVDEGMGRLPVGGVWIGHPRGE